MRSVLVFLILLLLKMVSRTFYRIEMRWIGDTSRDPWREIRLVAFLHHTSLFEPVFAGGCPNHFLWRLARHGVVPAADKTINRPVVGMLFRFVAHHVVSVTRQRDHTWFEVLRRIDPDTMIVILPEGRMMRRNGLDSQGNPMTVRGGISDIIDAVGEGRMLLAYSGGLHHVQAPGELIPRVFETVRANLEIVDIAAYRRELLSRYGPDDFKKAVRIDLEKRRDERRPV
ncbi:MAG TPA: hypothetical protein VM534_11285 [Thermoanaerobaculia bacterium]|nr:hypothetical protein [Thermoanaerobaculia bacterium]